MRTNHALRFFIQLIISFIFISLGITAIIYSSLGVHPYKDWITWAIVACVSINVGLVFLVNATVHRVKQSLLKRRKSPVPQGF